MFVMATNVQKKGTGSFCAQHPSGLSGKTNLSPFSARALACEWKILNNSGIGPG